MLVSAYLYTESQLKEFSDLRQFLSLVTFMNFNHVIDKTSQERLPLAINYIKRMKTPKYKNCTDCLKILSYENLKKISFKLS